MPTSVESWRIFCASCSSLQASCSGLMHLERIWILVVSIMMKYFDVKRKGTLTGVKQTSSGVPLHYCSSDPCMPYSSNKLFVWTPQKAVARRRLVRLMNNCLTLQTLEKVFGTCKDEGRKCVAKHVFCEKGKAHRWVSLGWCDLGITRIFAGVIACMSANGL